MQLWLRTVGASLGELTNRMICRYSCLWKLKNWWQESNLGPLGIKALVLTTGPPPWSAEQKLKPDIWVPGGISPPVRYVALKKFLWCNNYLLAKISNGCWTEILLGFYFWTGLGLPKFGGCLLEHLNLVVKIFNTSRHQRAAELKNKTLGRKGFELKLGLDKVRLNLLWAFF